MVLSYVHARSARLSKLLVRSAGVLIVLAASAALFTPDAGILRRSLQQHIRPSPLRPRALRPPLLERLKTDCPALQQLATPANPDRRPAQAELLSAARRAQDTSGTMILTVGNAAAFINLFPGLLESMRFANASGMATHLVAVATSPHAMELCSRFHGNCVLDDWSTSLGSDPGSEKQGGGSPGYHSIVWRKPELVRDLVRAGIDVLCMDMDVVVFQNVLQPWVLPYRSGADVLVSHHYPGLKGGAERADRMLNSGFYHIRATQPSKALLDAWLHPDRRTGCAGGSDQGTLEVLLYAYSAELGVTWVGIPDAVGFTACRDEAGAFESGPTQSLTGLLQQVQRLQLDEGQKDRLAFVHLACFPSPSSTLPDQPVSRALAMKVILNYYVAFRNGLSTEHHVQHALRID